MKTVIISFSSRPNGNCSQIGKLISSLTQDAVLFDFSKFDLHPCGHCAAECFEVREDCPYSEDKEFEILDAVLHSDVVYFVLPNHCDYPNANYFIFNERSQCFFQEAGPSRKVSEGSQTQHRHQRHKPGQFHPGACLSVGSGTGNPVSVREGIRKKQYPRRSADKRGSREARQVVYR